MLHAPERWSETEGVVWRTKIEGSGNSSPVIVGNRAYVTTAISWERRTIVRLVCDCLIGCLSLFGIPTMVYYRWKQRLMALSGGRQGGASRHFERLDAAAFVLLAVTVLVCGAMMAIGPRALDAGLHAVRDIGVTIARSLGRLQTNLSFLTWADAAPHNRWIISSAMALAALGLTPFLFPVGSIIRGGATADRPYSKIASL